MAAENATWTEAVIADLRRLWDEGHTTAEIGRRMGLSKNAVVGKAHRLALPPRPSPIRRAARPARAPAPGPVPSSYPPQGLPVRAVTVHVAPPTPERAPAAPPGPVESRRQAVPRPCCWPLGEPGRAGFRFCGQDADAGKPYCAEHRALAYAKPPRQQPAGHAA